MDLPWKEFNTEQLNGELQALKLPGFTGVASRRGEYIRIKCDVLTPEQEVAVKKVVADHVPKPPEPTAQDKARAKLEALKGKTLTSTEFQESVQALIELVT